MIRVDSTGAIPFCQAFTTAVVTNTAALPTYASMCFPNPVLGISPACSCYVTPTTTLPALRAANVTPAPERNEDNCLRAMIREGNAVATPFCHQFTTAVVTDTAALPSYASMCTPNPIQGISSACTCYVLKPTAVCNQDNCLRTMIREGGAGATTFCSHFTTAVITNPAALPTYASMCTPDAVAGISSACSCIHQSFWDGHTTMR
jgi:hypothetical protein